MSQPSLFAGIEVRPTPAIDAGQASVWGCRWCGSIVYRTDGTAKPGACACCQHADTSWYRVDEPGRGSGHYEGPFYRRLSFDGLREPAEETVRAYLLEASDMVWTPDDVLNVAQEALAFALNVPIPESGVRDVAPRT